MPSKSESKSYIKDCPVGYKYYAARLLCQYRIEIVRTGECNKKRPCSLTTTLICAKTPKMALKKAKKIGKDKEVNYTNTDGNKVFVEFVGIVEMIEISFQIQFNEVWIWFGDMLTPMEKKDSIILSDDEILKRIS
ncbi:hypothetical protein FACS189443_3080 [Planctomycetales bacterium]|nr:hypothetical protein FACS189443_3080 [Planctomycetales bacterium]